MPVAQGRRCTGAWVAATALLLLVAGCDSATFTADVGTDAPADSQIARVQVNLLGLDFRRDDGTTTTLEFTAGEAVDLLDLQAGDPLRLFTDEELPPGRYNGVRLLFDDDQDDSVVSVSAGGELPLRLTEGAFATVDFAVVEEERSQEDLTLMLDLRQSLSFDEATDEYTLAPRLRVVRTAEAARIEGAVTAPCPAGTSLATGGAVYLYSGKDVEVDDLDGAAADPFATTRVTGAGVAGFSYALRFLPAGNYTLALTCRGDEDAVGENDELAFRGVREVEVGEGAVLQRNLD